LSSLLRAWYVFIGLALLTFVLVAFVGRVPYSLTSSIAAPGQLFYQAGRSARETLESMVDRRNLRQENAQLQEALEALQAERRQLEISLEQLESLLQVRNTQSPGAVLTAPVLQVSPSPIIRQVVIGRGATSGIRRNMPVTTPEGLVGMVTEVAPRTSSVRAITDPQSAVGVTLRNKGGQGIAVGVPGGLVRVTDFREELTVEVGDIVETSSRGGLFPRGITLGVVVDVPPRDPNNLRIEFLVEPAVNMGMLTDVVLLEPL
jgi:rod shape-determining protein MreC